MVREAAYISVNQTLHGVNWDGIHDETQYWRTCLGHLSFWFGNPECSNQEWLLVVPDQFVWSYETRTMFSHSVSDSTHTLAAGRSAGHWSRGKRAL